MAAHALRRRRGFTLVELLVVVLIIGLVSVIALPTVIPAISHRQVSEAARVLQGALAGARDKAIHDGRPSGIRLLPDPAFNGINPTTGLIDPAYPLAYNRVVPIGPAPEYAEGFVTVRSAAAIQKTPYVDLATDPTGFGLYRWPTLVLEEAPFAPKGPAASPPPNPPTSWMWNIRVGDKVQLNGSGPWYTVVGPCWAPAAGRTFKDAKGNDVFVANPELFVNVGPPGFPSPLGHDYLLLTNGRDDNGNGLADEGWNGVDDNGDGLVDEHMPDRVATGLIGLFSPPSPPPPPHQTIRDEWEVESWLGAAAQGMTSVPYVIRRRPMPSPNAREVTLPTQMVIDATTVFATAERSRLPVDRFTGFVDVLINPDGTVAYNSPYGSQSSFGMADAFYHFWMAERQDVTGPPLLRDANGKVVQPPTPVPIETVNGVSHYLPIAEPGGRIAKTPSAPVLKGQYAILTLFARTGQTVTVENPPFHRDATHGFQDQVGTYSPNNPFIPSQQGAR